MRTPARPFLFLVFTVLVVSLACSALTGGNTPAPQQVPTEPPSQIQLPPPATEAPVLPTSAPEQPTIAPPPAEGQLGSFKEEFNTNTNMGNWTYFTSGPGSKDDSKLKVETMDDGLLFDMGTLDLYVYYLYEPQLTYKDTTVTLVAENRGANNNNISLVCRLNYDKLQWYEYSFESGGLWYLYSVSSGSYKKMADGGSNDLHQGLAVNEYAMTCEGNTISIYINGKKLKTYTDKVNYFGEGQVGFNISSLNVLPVIVNVKSFEVSEK